MPDIDAASPLLRSLEDLGALTDRAGLFEVKPFRDWRGTPWRHKIFSMRLCNAGESFDIDSYLNDVPENARIEGRKFEFLIRSVFAIDGKILLTPEELQTYNTTTKADLTHLQYLRMWVRNLEQLVVNRLDAVYGGLELKQVRHLQKIVLCEGCGTTYHTVPEGSKKLKYSLGEILCPHCLTQLDGDDYDVDDTVVVKKEEESTPKTPPPPGAEEGASFTFQSYSCGCGKEIESLEELVSHRETCPKAGAVST
jgi:hypothetical protein